MEKAVTQRAKRIGMVVSDKMDKTIVVKVERRVAHKLYHRTLKMSKKFLAHDETNQAKIGDLVEIIEARPLSRRKRWRLRKILETKN